MSATDSTVLRTAPDAEQDDVPVPEKNQLFENWTVQEKQAFDSLVHQLLKEMRDGKGFPLSMPLGVS